MKMAKEARVCEVFLSSRGGLKLFRNGYSYTRNRITKDITYWICDRKRDKKCNTSLVTKVNEDGNHVIKRQLRHHKHPPDTVKRGILDFMLLLKRECLSEEYSTTEEVIRYCKSKTSPEVLERLPSQEALKQVISRVRNKGKPKRKKAAPVEVYSDTEEFYCEDQHHNSTENNIKYIDIETVKQENSNIELELNPENGLLQASTRLDESDQISRDHFDEDFNSSKTETNCKSSYNKTESESNRTVVGMDEFDHFGLMIAAKIRKMNNFIDREVIMNDIQNMVFKAVTK